MIEPDAAGRDLIVSARTGSGKTVAFGMAMAAELLGEDDRIIPLSHGVLAAAQIDGATLHRFPACGHHPHRERPNRFLALLRGFLGDPAS